MEWHFPSDVHTFEFHEHRERAPHLEQDDHRARLIEAARLIGELRVVIAANDADGIVTGLPMVSDLGCGDGGLLQLLMERGFPECWGYDFAPSNIPGWIQRGVQAESVDVFNDPSFPMHIRLGEVVVLTEVLEHLEFPHVVVSKLGCETGVRYIVASSPWFETAEAHGDCHQWAWDWEGYEKLFTDRGWKIREHVAVDWSQIVVAER